MSCYSGEERVGNFLNYDELLRIKCGVLLSSISAESGTDRSISLDIQIIQLGWWVNGDECRCSGHANCTGVPAVPGGGNGYRCRCIDGFVGDGFLDGSGCRRGKVLEP